MQLTQAQLSIFNRAKQVSQAAQVDYAISLLEPLVKEQPELLEARKLLRANEIRRIKGEKNESSIMNASGGMAKLAKIQPLALRAATVLKKNPLEAMSLAEDMLKIDPYSAQGNQVLADAAEILGYKDIRVFAFEIMAEAKPNDLVSVRNLGYAYLTAGNTKQAMEAFQAALRISPNDGDTIRGMKDSSASNAQATGGWETKGDGKDAFRAALKDSSEAISLEQASRAVTSDEAIDAQISEWYAKMDPQNPEKNVVLKIAELYEKKKDKPHAIQWYDYAFEVSGRADAALQRNADRLRAKLLDETIEAKEAEIEAAPTPEQKAALQEELGKMKSEKAVRAVSLARERLEKYPNDLQLRFELACALVKIDNHKEAVPELQQAIRQPNIRHQALILLGVCFWKAKMLPLAKKQFETAESEMVGMDDVKKEALHKLALVKEEMGDKEGYMAELMKIYEVDSQYEDVAQRIEKAMSASS